MQLWMEQEIEQLKHELSSTEITEEDFAERTQLIKDEAERQKRAALSLFGNDFYKGNPAISPLRGALAVFGLTADDIGVASFHGTSTKANDKNVCLAARANHVTAYPIFACLSQMLNLLTRQSACAGVGCAQLAAGAHWTHSRQPGPGHLPKVPDRSPKRRGCRLDAERHHTGKKDDHLRFAVSGFGGVSSEKCYWPHACAQAMNDGVVPGNRNADNIDAELQKFDNIIFPSKSLRTGMIKAGLLKSFGFGQVPYSLRCLGLHLPPLA